MIVKIGLAIIRKKKLLLLKKKDLAQLILPGGKQGKKESERKTLERELDEELKVKLKFARKLGKFEDVAAGRIEKLKIILYIGEINGKIVPSSEIKSAHWLSQSTRFHLSPILKNKIIPFLERKKFL